MSNISINPNQPKKVGITKEENRVTVTETGHVSVNLSPQTTKIVTVSTPGITGNTGPQGIQGPAGNDGADGADGAQGPQGEQGPSGSQGPQGEQGPSGSQGPQGEQGPSGSQGPAGNDGADGVDGITQDTGSLITTASATLNRVTFTKGDSSAFTITIDTGSGGGGDSTDYVSNVSFANGNLSFTGVGSAFASTVDLGTIISSSIQIGNDISGSFYSLSSSVASDIEDITDGTTTVASASYSLTASHAENVSSLKAGLLSSSAQIATDISGSFIEPSASFSTRVTNNDAKVGYTDSAVTSVIHNNSVISSSAQLATDISGSFYSTSASIASDIEDIIDGTTLITSASFSITASYAENGSQDYISNVEFTDGDLSFTGTGNAFDGNVDLDSRYVLAGGGSGGSLASRQEVSGSTGTLSNLASQSLDITGYRGYGLYKIETDRAAWVRLYTNTGSRTSDHSRNHLTDPLPDAGVIAEVITTGAETIQLSPAVIGFNNEGTPTSNIPTLVQNRSGGSASVTVTLTVLQMEA